MMIKKLLSLVLLCLFLFVSATAAFADLAVDGKIVVCLDPGHGGIDGGTNVGTKTEKEYNWALASYLRDALLADGRFAVVLTREDDSYLKYLPRAEIAKEANADVLISLHCNQVAESYVSGTSAYVSLVDTYSSSALAEKILDAVSSAVDLKRGKVTTRSDTGDSLGVYYWNAERKWDMPGDSSLGQVSDYYSMNTWSSKFGIPSIIIEHGYLSNENDLAILNDDNALRLIAQAEADAIVAHYTDHDHSFQRSVDYPSNCVFAGTASDRCTVCGVKRSTTALPPDGDGHYWRLTSQKPATCTEGGEEHYVCQISYNLNDKGYACDVHEKTVETPALGHQYQTVEQNGRTVRQCLYCGDVIETLCSDGGAHRYEKTDETPPTCENDGSIRYRCANCGDEYTDILPAFGHTYDIKEEKEATRDEDGYRVLVCTVCGDEKRETLALCEHLMSEIRCEPTCTADGEITRCCALCGHVETEVLPALGHSLEDITETAPTCEIDGETCGHCTRCGEDIRETLPATGHSFTKTLFGSVCSVCGGKKETRGLEWMLEYPIYTAGAILIAAIAAAVLILLIKSPKPTKKRHHTEESMTRREQREAEALVEAFYQDPAIRKRFQPDQTELTKISGVGLLDRIERIPAEDDSPIETNESEKT